MVLEVLYAPLSYAHTSSNLDFRIVYILLERTPFKGSFSWYLAYSKIRIRNKLSALVVTDSSLLSFLLSPSSLILLPFALSSLSSLKVDIDTKFFYKKQKTKKPSQINFGFLLGIFFQYFNVIQSVLF